MKMYYFVLLCMSILLTGCFNSKKLDKWVATAYEPGSVVPEKKKPDFVIINSKLQATGDKASVSDGKTSHILPLIFYFHMEYDVTCTLNPQIPVNNFIKTFSSYAGSKKMKQKLNGRQLELTVENLPHAFSVNDDGHMIFLILYAYSWDILDVETDHKELVVSYKIEGANEQTKTGTINIPDINKKYHLKIFESLKKKTLGYIDQYNANITTMSKQWVDQLLKEL